MPATSTAVAASLLTALALGACAAPVTKPFTGAGAVAPGGGVAEATAAPLGAQKDALAAYEPDEAFLTDDDRPIGLPGISSAWATDWSIHSVPYAEIRSGGVPRDGIPPIDDPRITTIADADGWLADNEPIIAVALGGQARAYPLQILMFHEIANDELSGVPIAVTFCPLCNAGLAFDRRWSGAVLDFGVSGLLRHSDLIMWDRQTESLWQQLEGQAIVGRLTGAQLTVLPAFMLSWADFKGHYPAGDVLSRESGGSGRYGLNPYAGYDAPGERPFLFDGAVDDRRPATLRVVAVERGGEAVAYPFDRLAEVRVANDTVAGEPVVVFWKAGTASALDAGRVADGRDVGAAAVFDPRVAGRTLTFAPREDGRFEDVETGSTWTLLGRAVEGELAGTELEPVLHASHFWFAWAAFRPDTRLWEGD